MPKRIEFIAPVEAVRGNMSGKQTLVYPTKDNSAFDSPEGKVNYAKNYRPSYVGAKRSSSGLKYFTVRTKNAVNLSVAAKRNMATNGGSFAIVSKILADKSLATSMRTQYFAAVNAGQFSGTLRQFVNSYVFEMISNYMESIDINFIGLTNKLYNPWYDGVEREYRPSNDVIVKFWKNLHLGGITFYVNNLTGIADQSSSFEDFALDNPMNVLGLTQETIGGVTYIKMGQLYLRNTDGEYVKAEDTVITNGKYTTTAVAPTA